MLSKTDAVILCGGQGKRLQPVVSSTSKVMADVGGRPFLDILVGHLKKQGIRRVILCTGYKADQVEGYYRENPPLKGTYGQGLAFEFSRESDPLGTGGALKNARYFIESDPFLVFNGDSFCAVDLNAFLDFHQSKLARASVVVSSSRSHRSPPIREPLAAGEEPIGQAGDTSSFGKVFLDEDARVTGFREKETGGDQGVNAGVYCCNEDIFSFMPDPKRFSIEYDLFPALVDKGFYGFAVDAEFYDIGTPERYAAARQALERIKK